MIESVVRTDLGSDWAYLPADERSDDHLVGEHESGAQLWFDDTPRNDHSKFVCNITYPVVYKGVRADPVVSNGVFEDEQRAMAWVREAGQDVSENPNQLGVIAMAPHGGDIASTPDDFSSISTTDLLNSSFVDIFCVNQDVVPDKVSVDDIREHGAELMAAIYGDPTAELPDGLIELNDRIEAYDSTTISVYTVTDEEIRRAS